MNMLWKRLLIFLIALAALFIIPDAAFTESPPTPPCRFYGTVQLDGVPVPDGTVITAAVAGDTYTTITPEVKYGSSTYVLMLVPLVGTSYDEGSQITFKIGIYAADQTANWETGGNTRLDLSASIPPTPSPTPMPTATPTPTVTPTPLPTVAPVLTPTPTPASTEAATNAWDTLIIALCVCILIICFMFAAYLVWKYRFRPPAPRGEKAEVKKPEGDKGEKVSTEEKPGAVKTEGDDITGQQAQMSIRWQDRLMLKMMSNKLVIKIFSIPIVMKVLMWETKVFLSIMSLFSRKKAEIQETPAEKAEKGEPESKQVEGDKTEEVKENEDKTNGGKTEV
jgi:hypothetical protein